MEILWFEMQKFEHHTAISLPSRFYKRCFQDFLIIPMKSRDIKRFFFSGGVIDYSGNLIIIVAFCEKLFTVYYKSS